MPTDSANSREGACRLGDATPFTTRSAEWAFNYK